MFDEISSTLSLQRVLTDVHVKPIGTNHWSKHDFKIDSGACGNLMPLSMFKSLYNRHPSSAMINSAVHLLDYNKHEIKQLGFCVASVKYRSKVKHVPFKRVSDKLKPILGMGDALALGLTSFHCPIYTDWQSNLTNGVDSIHPNAYSTVCTGTGRGIVNSTPWEFTMDTSTKQAIHSNANSAIHTGTNTVNSTTQEFTMGTLTKQAIINHPKYVSLFSGIGHFRCSPVHITMKQNSTPLQKPPERVPIAIKDKFKHELDAMEA